MNRETELLGLLTLATSCGQLTWERTFSGSDEFLASRIGDLRVLVVGRHVMPSFSGIEGCRSAREPGRHELPATTLPLPTVSIILGQDKRSWGYSLPTDPAHPRLVMDDIIQCELLANPACEREVPALEQQLLGLVTAAAV
jgi:hypothetical protein